jgi:lipopolysaccharide export system permease protein
MRLTIVDRYILREVVQVWIAVMVILILVLASNSLVQLLGKVVEGELTGQVILPFFLLHLTSYFVTLIPLGLFLALLLAFGRLYAESEMAALGACGIGLAKLFRPVAILALAGAGMTAALTLWASPWAERASAEITARVAAESEFAGLAPGRFNRAGAGAVLFAETRSDGGGLREVFVVSPADQGGEHIVRARAADERIDRESGRRYLEFTEGQRYTIEPGSDAARSITFSEHGIHIPSQRVETSGPGAEGMSMESLLARGEPKYTAEFQWRVSLPIACFLLALAALPLSHTTPRKGRYGKIAIALLLYLAYSNLLVFARDMVEEGTVPAVLGMWWVHVATAIAVAALVAHRVGWRWAHSVIFSRAGVGA